MNDRNFQNMNEQPESRAKKFWKYVGITFLALFLATLTVVVINIK